MTGIGLATGLDALRDRRATAASLAYVVAASCAGPVDHVDGVHVALETAGAMIGKFDSMRAALRSFGGGPR